MRNVFRSSGFFLTAALVLLLAGCFSPWTGDEETAPKGKSGTLIFRLGGAKNARGSLVDLTTTPYEYESFTYKITLSGWYESEVSFSGTAPTLPASGIRTVGPFTAAFSATDPSGSGASPPPAGGFLSIPNVPFGVYTGVEITASDVSGLRAEGIHTGGVSSYISHRQDSSLSASTFTNFSMISIWVVNSWSELFSAVTTILLGPQDGIIMLGGPITAVSPTISIASVVNDIRIRGNGQTITRDTGFTNAFFDVTGGTLEMSNVTLDGNKTYVNSSNSLLTVSSGSAVLTNVTLQNNKLETSLFGQGAGIFVDAVGTLTMTGGYIQHNEIVHISTFGTIQGAGIANSGPATILDNVNIIQNALAGGVGVNMFGGGVHNTGTFTINGGTITGNKATDQSGRGGGAYNDGVGTFTMSSLSINNNTADQWGGGVFNDGIFKMVSGTIMGNVVNQASPFNGGGMYQAGNLWFSPSLSDIYTLIDQNFTNTAVADNFSAVISSVNDSTGSFLGGVSSW